MRFFLGVGMMAVMALWAMGVGMAFSESMPIEIEVEADKTEVARGRSVKLDVRVTDADSAPAQSCLLLAYVNGRRWGAHEVTEADGRARIILPFPNVGPASVQVRALPGFRDTCIVWARDPAV